MLYDHHYVSSLFCPVSFHKVSPHFSIPILISLYTNPVLSLFPYHDSSHFLFLLFSLFSQLRSLKTIFTAAIQKAFPQIVTEEFGTGIITRCGNPSFGDFQCNNSLSIAKYFKTLSDYSGISQHYTQHHIQTCIRQHHTTPHNLLFLLHFHFCSCSHLMKSYTNNHLEIFIQYYMPLYNILSWI